MYSYNKEASYSIPFIMPYFYYDGIDNDPNIFIEFYKVIFNKYDEFIKKIYNDEGLGRKYQRGYSKLWDNYSNFGFIIILYYCLTRSLKLLKDENVKSFYKEKFLNFSTDINGFNILDLKHEIDMLFGEEIPKFLKQRQTSNYNMFKNDISKTEENKRKNIVWYYHIYLDYLKKISLNDTDIDNNALKIKKIFFVSSNKFFREIDLCKVFNIPNNADVEYLDILDLKIDDHLHLGCNCLGEDCIEMIKLFKNNE